jgi:hypothetical protein
LIDVSQSPQICPGFHVKHREQGAALVPKWNPFLGESQVENAGDFKLPFGDVELTSKSHNL